MMARSVFRRRDIQSNTSVGGNDGAHVWSMGAPPKHVACHSPVVPVLDGNRASFGRGRPLQGCHRPQLIRRAWDGGDDATAAAIGS